MTLSVVSAIKRWLGFEPSRLDEALLHAIVVLADETGREVNAYEAIGLSMHLLPQHRGWVTGTRLYPAAEFHYALHRLTRQGKVEARFNTSNPAFHRQATGPHGLGRVNVGHYDQTQPQGVWVYIPVVTVEAPIPIRPA